MARRRPLQQSDHQQPQHLSIEEARKLVAKWDDDYEAFEHEGLVQALYRDVPASKVLDMWERGQNQKGRKLTSLEFEALACAIHNTFGALPTTRRVDRKQTDQPPKVIPPDDTKLSAKEVCRLIGVSASTLKRMVTAGTFPKPMRPTERRIAWPASDVRAFVEAMEAQRSKARR